MLRACLQLGSDERHDLLPVCRCAASLHYHQHDGRLTGLLYLLSVVCCQECVEEPSGEDALFIQILLAAVEYEVFIRMMRETAEEEKGLRK